MKPLLVELRLPEDQLEALASLIAARMPVLEGDGRPVTAAEAARLLNVTPDTIYRRIKAGAIKPVASVGKTLIARAEINRLLGHEPQPGGDGTR